MLSRQPLSPSTRAPRAVPRCWLMCDERLGDRILSVIAAMPPCSAVVVRPYAMQAGHRAAVIRAIRRTARAKRHLLLIAGRGSDAGYDGRHGYGLWRTTGFLSAAVHDRHELARAIRCGADAVLISPVWPTRSHPDSATLDRKGFARLAAASSAKAIALGGVTDRRFGQLRIHGAAGWAAIDAWLPRDTHPE